MAKPKTMLIAEQKPAPNHSQHSQAHHLTGYDTQLLAVFAYNRVLIRRYHEALPIYQMLAFIEPHHILWRLAQSLCLIHQNQSPEALTILNQIDSQQLPAHHFSFFQKLNHYAQKSQQQSQQQSQHQKGN